jgi:acyl carrier protein
VEAESSMSRDEIRTELRNILAVVSEKLAKRTDITDETTIRPGLGLDSLQILEMHFEIESRLSVTVDENDAKGIKTVGDLIGLIEARQMAPQGGVKSE